MTNSTNSIFDQSFWMLAWEKSRPERKENISFEKEIDKTVTMWNNRASSFAKNTNGDKNQKRKNAVFNFMDYFGIDLNGANVLDIGCGPGNYAISMAKKGARIWALDPATAMLDILKKRAEQENITNINYINKTWEAIDLEQEKWLNKFDLVFASMSPGINNQETLNKMNQVSKKYCFLSKFAGRRRNNLQEKVWRLVFKEDWADPSMDIIFPYNLLYSMGYFPSINFIHTNWFNDDTVVDTIKKLKDWISSYTEVSTKIESAIEEVVNSNAENGAVREKVEANIGMMIWQVK